MVAYFYPPAGGGGVQRTLAFARHLPRSGWSPTVLCGTARGYWARDPGLAWDVSAEVLRVPDGPVLAAQRLVRRVLPRSARSVFDRAQIPDPQLGWALPAVRAGARRLARERHRVIYATGAPWTNMLVGALLARRFRLPLVADFRDPWADAPLRPPAPALAPVHRALERWVVSGASWCLQTSPGYAAAMTAAYPDAQVLSLPNGFEEDDFDLELAPVPEPLPVGYAGSYYPGHGPEGLFRELAGLKAELSRDLRLWLYGNVGEAVPSEARLRVERFGYLPHRVVLQRLAGCKAVFCTVPRVPGAEGCVPQKLYIYLRLNRPVLFWGPDGDAADILRRSGGRHLLLTEHGAERLGSDGDARPRGSGEALASWLSDLRAEPDPRADNDVRFVRSFERSEQTRRLAGILDDAVRSAEPSP